MFDALSSSWTLWLTVFASIVWICAAWYWNRLRELEDFVWDSGDKDRAKRLQKRVDYDYLGSAFPKDFFWGVASAAHQIEGYGNAKSNWSEWEKQVDPATRKPRVHKFHSARKSCDHWNRVEDDLDLVKALGCNAYRFSVAWDKVQPDGPDHWDEAVISHYQSEIRAMCSRGLEPMLTLHHFVHPLWFEQLGGFEQRANIKHFVAFSERMFLELSGDVRYWCTVNEPVVLAYGGHNEGIFPPGKKSLLTAGRVLGNLLLAHVEVVAAIRQLPGGSEAELGIVKDIFQFEPKRWWHPIDVALARFIDTMFNGITLHFLRTGEYSFPSPWLPLIRKKIQLPDPGDSFVGLNYYSHFHVSLTPFAASGPFSMSHKRSDLVQPMFTDMDYPMYPQGLRRALWQLTRALPALPIFVTENGLADATDDRRALFIRRYVAAMAQAVREGVKVRGYFFWSFMDNFEWAEGYTMRFGLYAVDFATQQRTLRHGAQPFQEIIAAWRAFHARDRNVR